MDRMAIVEGHTDRRAAPTASGPEESAVAQSAPAGRTSIRPEIQALRATAVVLVVTYHVWPDVLPGGFVGVDVFFAISGFLITSLLLREIDRTGTISLTSFWARRARRILPAALMMLLVCGLATVALVPQTYWPQFLAEIRASTIYVQNWHLADAAVDYMAAADAPSPVQHYWSLSTEEQFYLVWPVLLIGAAVIARRRGLRVRRGAIAAVMAVVTAASFAYSVYDTAADTAAAYFVTPTRAWEFGAGGLLAVAPLRGAAAAAASRALLSWVGIAAIVIAALTFDDATPFPGYTALLPVLGAVAVMRAGMPDRPWAPSRALGARPVQFLGDVSYAVYLWHWPLLVLAPFAIGGAVHTSTGVEVIMLTVLAAWATKVLVEDPVRSARFLVHRRPGWTFALAGIATACVLMVPAGGNAYVQAQINRAERVSRAVLASHPRCFGAAARDPRRPCDNPRLRFTVVPSPVQARSLGNAPCTVVQRKGRLRVCAFGAPPSRAVATIALIGDSHASHWRAALDVMARERRWRGLSITHTSCPFSTATPDIVQPDRSRCVQWNGQLRAWFGDHPEVTTVFIAAHSGGRVLTRRSNFAAQVAGYTGAWHTLPRTVTRVVVMRDTPKMRGSTLACVESAMRSHRRPGPACAVARRAALQRDPEVVAVRRMHSRRFQVADLTPQLCSRRLCFPVIGGALVYHDIHHFTPVFARTLAPFVGRDLDAMPPPAP